MVTMLAVIARLVAYLGDGVTGVAVVVVVLLGMTRGLVK